MSVRILNGDCREQLRTLPDESVHCVVTSPPYWGLRDYRHDGQIGQEKTPEEYTANLVGVFREARRVLRADGTLWLNLGDSYAATTKGSSGKGEKQVTNAGTMLADRSCRVPAGLKPKDLVGIPWRVAFALQSDGWWLRSEIIWAKPNPMPESVTDRPTKAHEQVFLLAKSERYAYDQEAVGEDFADDRLGASGAKTMPYAEAARPGEHLSFLRGTSSLSCGPPRSFRNLRTVWQIASQPFAGSHFATMPRDLAERCILAGCATGCTVLDPFGGAGTTGLVADRLGRNAILIDLNPDYCDMARKRIESDAPLFAEVST